MLQYFSKKLYSLIFFHIQFSYATSAKKHTKAHINHITNTLKINIIQYKVILFIIYI